MFIEVPEESTARRRRRRLVPAPARVVGLPAELRAPRSRCGPTWPRHGTRLNGSIRKHMDRRRYELVTIAAAREYRSTYCTAAHSKFLRDDCGDEATMRAIAADPSGATLDATDRAVIDFAAKVARDASSITAADVGRAPRSGPRATPRSSTSSSPCRHGAFFTKVLDALGVQADFQLGEMFDPELRGQVTVGRPIADA